MTNNYKIYLLWLFLLLVAVVASWQMWVAMAKKRLKNIMSTTKFINPTAQTFRISSGFGSRTAPKAGASTFHNGIDIACPTGTPVLAVADGIVDKVWNDTSAGGGLSIRIKHNDGYQTGYAHLSRQDVQEGQKVTMGQQTALSGNSGNSTGAHLHFTLKYNGVAIDPQQYFYI